MTICQKISSEQFKLLAPQDSVVIDVRTKMEHDEKRLTRNHFHIPLDELDPEKFIKEHQVNSGKTIYFLCRGGTRAAKAAEKFLACGYNNVCVIEGGLTACESCGEAVEGYTSKSCSTATSKCRIPLERQVRIAAGSIVLIGSILALTSSVLFAAIPLFVGAGLIFAGITDRCGMALILTKAPWNKVNQQLKNRLKMPKEYKNIISDISAYSAELRKLIPETMSGFSAMAKAATQTKVLDEKTKELIALALGVAARCDGCLGFHAKSLVRLNATREEVAEVLGMAVYMGGGPSLMYAADALRAFDQFSAKE